MNRELRAIGESIRTQDNRMTNEPIFVVEQKRGRHWVFATACFTEQGCKDYLAANGHNLKSPRVYVYSGYRNAEWIALRAALKARPSDEVTGLLARVKELEEDKARLEYLFAKGVSGDGKPVIKQAEYSANDGAWLHDRIIRDRFDLDAAMNASKSSEKE